MAWYEYHYQIEEGDIENGPCLSEYRWLVEAPSPQAAIKKAEAELDKEYGARRYGFIDLTDADPELVQEWLNFS